MSGVSRMTGTSWHVTALSTSKEGRIDKRRCKFFDKKSGNCTCSITSKYLKHCIGSARCDKYKEIENIENIKSRPLNAPIVKKSAIKSNICVGDNVDIKIMYI